MSDHRVAEERVCLIHSTHGEATGPACASYPNCICGGPQECQFIKRSGKCNEPATHETPHGIAMCETHWLWCEATT